MLHQDFVFAVAVVAAAVVVALTVAPASALCLAGRMSQNHRHLYQVLVYRMLKKYIIISIKTHDVAYKNGLL